MAAQDDYDTLQGLAERMIQRGEMKEENADNFIQDAMSRLGHKMKALWEDGDEDAPQGRPTSMFGDRPGSRGGSQRQRPTGTSGGQYRE